MPTQGPLTRRTIAAIENDGSKQECLILQVEYPESCTDVQELCREVVTDYCNTKPGRAAYKSNGEHFNWGDILDIPVDFTRRYGLHIITSRMADMVVDWTEQLVDSENLNKIDQTPHS